MPLWTPPPLAMPNLSRRHLLVGSAAVAWMAAKKAEAAAGKGALAVCPPVAMGATAPAWASGTDPSGNVFAYTTLVGGAGFDNTTDVSTDLSGNTTAPLYALPIVTGPGKWGIANSILTINAETTTGPDSHNLTGGYGDGIESVAGVNQSDNATHSMAPTTTISGVKHYGYAAAGQTPPKANGSGTAFRYGCFVCRARTNFQNDTQNGSWNPPTSYYPTFWMYPTSAGRVSNSTTGFMELDIFEMTGPWFSDTVGPFGLIINTSGPSWSGTSGGDWPKSAVDHTTNAWNIYSVVWTPSYITYTVNGTSGGSLQLDTPVSTSAGSQTLNAAMGLATIWEYIIAGTGDGWPVDYDYMYVFQ